MRYDDIKPLCLVFKLLDEVIPPIQPPCQLLLVCHVCVLS